MPKFRKDSVVVDIESKFTKIPNSAAYNPKIFKVYDKLRQMNESAYDPVLVAIGPVHHDKDHVKVMEQVKLPDSDRFVEMLLLDGFFVIELLRKIKYEELRSKNDYIFHSQQARHRVLLDLLLVENQLPLFILVELFDMTESSNSPVDLSLLVRMMCSKLPWKKDLSSLPPVDDRYDDDHHHLLGKVYRAYFSSETATQGSENEIHLKFHAINSVPELEAAAQCKRPEFYAINSASELEDSGIQFKKAKGVLNMDVSFTSTSTDGVMQLSHLCVQDSTETLLRNLIAYEQMMPNNPDRRCVTDYSILMTCLLNSSKDFMVLRHAGILENTLGDDNTVCHMFNLLGKHVTYYRDDFRYLEVFEKVNKHCSRRRNRWMATLRRNYFNSPWSILSVIAAVALLILTATHTVFTILS